MAAGLAALAFAVLALGGAPRWAVVSIAVLAALSAASQIGSRRRLDGVSPLLVVIGIATALTFLQIIPLPESLVEALNPTGHALVADGSLLVDPNQQQTAVDRGTAVEVLKGPWRPLSTDPATTRVELAKLCAYFLLAWMALRAAASDRGRHRLLVGVAGCAGVVALIGIVHELVGAERLFGFYDPAHANPLVMAPLLNPNHLACLMVIGALVAGSLAIEERRAPPIRVLWILIAIACVGVCLGTRSRGGVMALGAGATIAAFIMVLQQLRASGETKRADVLRVALPAAVIVLCSLVLAVYLGGDVQQDLSKTSLDEISDPRSKYAAWQSALTLVEEAPVFGVGRGAFESAFTRVHPPSSQVTFSHLENEYLQTVVDWGIVGAVALAAALGFAVIVAARRWRSGPLAAGALGALAAVAVQSLVDFGVELPGIAVPTAIVASTLLYVPLKETSRNRRRRVLRAIAVGAALIAGVVAATPFARSLAEDHDALRDKTPTLARAKDAFRRHPLDYLSASYIAHASKEPRQQIAFINHALRLHPTHSGLHRTVARWLVSAGRPKQAAIEYRLALAGSNSPEGLVNEILSAFPHGSDAAKALPPTHRMWGRITKTLTDAKRSDVALQYLTEIVDKQARHGPEIWRRLFNLAEQQADLVIARRAARELVRFDNSLATTIRLARLQLKLLRYDDALATLTPFATEVVTRAEHLEVRDLICDIHIARTHWVTARDCLNALLLAPSVTLQMRRKIHGRLAKVEDALGNKERAAFERKLASDASLDPVPPSR